MAGQARRLDSGESGGYLLPVGQALVAAEAADLGDQLLQIGDALGGNTYYTGSLELKFPLGLPEEVGVSGAAFTDIGSLWDVDSTGAGIFDKNTPRISAGVGVAWASPFGPIRVDFAHALAKENADQTENVRFSFGTRF